MKAVVSSSLIVKLAALALFPSAAFSQTEVNIGGTIVSEGVIDLGTITTETHLALTHMLGMRADRLEADLPKGNSGDVFDDARMKDEARQRIFDYSEQFKEIVNQYGYISAEINDIALTLNEPKLSTGSLRYNGQLYEINGQSVCGLVNRVEIPPYDPYPYKSWVIVGYPSWDWVRFDASACKNYQPLEVPERWGPAKIYTNMSFTYNFADLDTGEKLYRTMQKDGAIASVRCALNSITREPEVNLMCNLESARIFTDTGILLYRVDWRVDSYKETWGPLNPMPR